MASTAAELDSRNEIGSVDGTPPPSESERLPAARIAFVRFTLAEIEQFPEDVPLGR